MKIGTCAAVQAHIPGRYSPLGEGPASPVEAAVLATVVGISLLLVIDALRSLSLVRLPTSFNVAVAAAPFAAVAAAVAAVRAAPFV